MSLTPRNTVTLGTPFEVDTRSVGGAQAILNTFNTPINSWNTIVFKKIVGGLDGDTLRLSVFKGSIPDDPNTTEDDDETDAYLDPADFLDSADVVLDADIPAGGLSDVQFDFNTTFSPGNLGDTYTVVFEQFDSSDNPVQVSKIFCETRQGVSNFTEPEDEGYPTVVGAMANATIGGAGNAYTLNNAAGLYASSVTIFAVFINGQMETDSVMPLALFERSPYGTSRNLTGSLTSSTSFNII